MNSLWSFQMCKTHYSNYSINWIELHAMENKVFDIISSTPCSTLITRRYKDTISLVHIDTYDANLFQNVCDLISILEGKKGINCAAHV